MTFAKLAYSRAVLRAASDPGSLKKEAMLGAALGAAGKVGKFIWNQGVKHNGMLAPLALGAGALGMGSALSKARQQTQAYNAGFTPPEGVMG